MSFRSRKSLQETVEYAVRELKNPARRRTVLSVTFVILAVVSWYVYQTLRTR